MFYVLHEYSATVHCHPISSCSFKTFFPISWICRVLQKCHLPKHIFTIEYSRCNYFRVTRLHQNSLLDLLMMIYYLALILDLCKWNSLCYRFNLLHVDIWIRNKNQPFRPVMVFNEIGWFDCNFISAFLTSSHFLSEVLSTSALNIGKDFEPHFKGWWLVRLQRLLITYLVPLFTL